MTKDKPTTRRFPIVGIGASAGGLEALDELLDHLPPDTGMAFVVVTHQHPSHTSLLPELLARETKMPVVPATDGIELQPNHVYVGTPGGRLTIRNSMLRRVEDNTQSVRLPIDSFFRSLAADQKEHAICIVLSGTGTDGTLGLKAIKAESGMAMVQLVDSAKYAGMPSSAESTGLADYVLAPADMPPQLVAYAQGPYLRDARLSGDASSTDQPVQIEAKPMEKIFQLLCKHTGHDFSGYKANTIRRRIERRMNVHQIENPEDYVQFLDQNTHEIESLFKELLISVTSFFRDPELWDALASGPLPQLLKTAGSDTTIRAWVPGCATGEEVYTLAMVMRECSEKLKLRLNYQIFGTDLDSAAIETARMGRFAAGITEDVSPERLDRFFTDDNGHYTVRKEVREMAIFAPQNLIKDPPFTKLDIITCRNLLIYLDADLQKQLMPIFHYALKPGGLLVLGSSETTGNYLELFETVDKKWKVYRRKETAPAIHRIPAMPAAKNSEDLLGPTASNAVSQVREPQVAALLERVALDRFCPTFVVVNKQGDLVHVHGRTGDYFELAQGHARTNVLDMAREGLPHELATIMRLASTTEDEVIRSNVRVKTNGDFTLVRLVAKRITCPESIGGLIFITFQPVETAHPPAFADETIDGSVLGQIGDSEALTRELQFLRETHQATLQELETSNEELKSANEELQSTNEEMQSTNEELETSKEEMQSLNEELTTVNVELQSKVNDLSQANDDMQNLLNSTDIATVFLNDDLQISRYTVQAPQIISLRPTDVGRPLSDLNSNLKDVDLIGDCKAVLDTLVPKKLRVETVDGTWYLMRIMPYRTTDNVIDGLVLTFVNIQELKAAETAGEMRTYFESIFNTVREPLVVLDEEYAVISANQFFYDTFKLQSNEVVGQSLYEIKGGAWNLPKLKQSFDEIISKDTTIKDLEIEQDFADLGERKFVLNARRLSSLVTFPGRLLLVMQEGPK
ncbi:chemotaxis protein CheB [Rubripirellula reticaptiva]|uniref:chemotaxis protein CheB n=1 Tax=Rubripirellula reticaptiva TaxID=2528013 RepID=UPI00164951E5|nr:chemotaxis protein CheB [Rubripirellula reticaptiva]